MKGVFSWLKVNAVKSEEHKELAAHHGIQVDQAEDSLAHFGLVGANREIQDHEFDYDLMGNLIARSDHAMDLHETFGYDALNRLESYIRNWCTRD